MNKKKIRSILSTIVAIIVVAIYVYDEYIVPLIESEAQEQSAPESATPSSSARTAPSGAASSRTSSARTASANAGYELPDISAVQQDSVIRHIGYTVLYDQPRRIPRWVAYELTSDELMGDEERSSTFKRDPLWKGEQGDHKDYTGSGYDRGHMAPAADMKWSEEAMHESFYVTNICPQLHNLNAGDWKSLEELVRDLAAKYGNIYVVCGPIVGKAKGGKIGQNGVVVPDSFFKALLVKSSDGWHSIAFIMNNEAGKKPLMTYALTVNDLEKKCGLDLFTALPDSVEEDVESQFDFSVWTVSR